MQFSYETKTRVITADAYSFYKVTAVSPALTTSTTTPCKFPLSFSIDRLSFHTLARNKDGTLLAWGDNRFGALGARRRRNTSAQIVTARSGIGYATLQLGLCQSVP